MTIYRSIIASSLMLLTVILVNKVNVIGDTPIKIPLSNFPKQIGKWSGEADHFDQSIYDALGVDDSFYADYRSKDAKIINLYIGFYKSQSEGDIIHSPKNCMPGGGWNIIESSLEELEIQSAQSGILRVVKLVLQKGSEKQIAFYWYQSRGRVITSEYMQKIYLIVDSVFRKRTDGSLVRLIAPVRQKEVQATIESLKAFTKLIYPYIIKHIPS